MHFKHSQLRIRLERDTHTHGGGEELAVEMNECYVLPYTLSAVQIDELNGAKN